MTGIFSDFLKKVRQFTVNKIHNFTVSKIDNDNITIRYEHTFIQKEQP